MELNPFKLARLEKEGNREARSSSWAKEFERRVQAGQKIDWTMGKARIQDALGNWFTKSGKACCGCGRHWNMSQELDQDNVPLSRPGEESPTW